MKGLKSKMESQLVYTLQVDFYASVLSLAGELRLKLNLQTLVIGINTFNYAVAGL